MSVFDFKDPETYEYSWQGDNKNRPSGECLNTSVSMVLKNQLPSTRVEELILLSGSVNNDFEDAMFKFCNDTIGITAFNSMATKFYYDYKALNERRFIQNKALNTVMEVEKQVANWCITGNQTDERYCKWNAHGTWEMIRNELSLHYPVVVLIQLTKSTHAITILKELDHTFLCHDPEGDWNFRAMRWNKKGEDAGKFVEYAKVDMYKSCAMASKKIDRVTMVRIHGDKSIEVSGKNGYEI